MERRWKGFSGLENICAYPHNPYNLRSILSAEGITPVSSHTNEGIYLQKHG